MSHNDLIEVEVRVYLSNAYLVDITVDISTFLLAVSSILPELNIFALATPLRVPLVRGLYYPLELPLWPDHRPFICPGYPCGLWSKIG